MSQDKKYVLLIWELMPERVDLYLIDQEEITNQFREYLKQAHGHLINCSETNEGMDFLNHALTEYPDDFQDGKFKDHIGIWAKYMWMMERPITNFHITEVYKSGFAL